MTETATSVGRPSDYNDDIAEHICLRLSDGETLMSVCSDPVMPARTTVYQWLDRNASFTGAYARARERQADAHADEILAAATLPADCTSAQVNAARLRVDALKWTAAKLRPAMYGEHLHNKLTVDVGTGFAALLEEIDRRRPMIDVTPVETSES